MSAHARKLVDAKTIAVISAVVILVIAVFVSSLNGQKVEVQDVSETKEYNPQPAVFPEESPLEFQEMKWHYNSAERCVEYVANLSNTSEDFTATNPAYMASATMKNGDEIAQRENCSTDIAPLSIAEVEGVIWNLNEEPASVVLTLVEE